ncbi:MAG: hypothetical protein ACKPFF_22875, partial [Planktothrix sp.]
MLAETVDFIGLETLFDALEVNRATGYRYLNRISKLLENCSFWRYQSRDGSLDNDGIKIFELFTTIAKEHSPQFAEKQIIKELEKHGYKIDKNNGTNYRRNNTTGQNNE